MKTSCFLLLLLGTITSGRSPPICSEPDGGFVCLSGDQCISKDLFCDGTPDCEDKSDEFHDECLPINEKNGHGSNSLQIVENVLANLRSSFHSLIRSVMVGIGKILRTTHKDHPKCSDDEFDCGNENQCIPIELKCDEEWDCPNGEDETPIVCSQARSLRHSLKEDEPKIILESMIEPQNVLKEDLEMKSPLKMKLSATKLEEIALKMTSSEEHSDHNESLEDFSADEKSSKEFSDDEKFSNELPIDEKSIEEFSTDEKSLEEVSGDEKVALERSFDDSSDNLEKTDSENVPLDEDEIVCGEKYFMCDSTCIPKRWVCDGVTDCIDRTDEKNCESDS